MYASDPCGVLPNALWKTIEEPCVDRGRVARSNGRVEALDLDDRERLLVAWNRKGRSTPHVWTALNRVRLALLHDRAAAEVEPLTRRFTRRTAYSRLQHDMSPKAVGEFPSGCSLRDVTMPENARAVSSFIVRCYDDMRVTPAAVRS